MVGVQGWLGVVGSRGWVGRGAGSLGVVRGMVGSRRLVGRGMVGVQRVVGFLDTYHPYPLTTRPPTPLPITPTTLRPFTPNPHPLGPGSGGVWSLGVVGGQAPPPRPLTIPPLTPHH